MRFLALLCGSNSFRGGSNHATGHQISRDRSESISKGRSASLGGKDDYRHHNMDATAMGTSATSSAIPTSTSTANYTPTTPQNLSRRILHTQGCGYYDDAVSLLLSAASDRFLSSVLTQAKACRDRRLEGHKATLVECRRRKRHRRRVYKERLEREKRFKEEVDRKRSNVEEVSTTGDAEKVKTNLKQSDIEKLQDFRKENEDIDKEEDYYHSYYEGGKMEYGEDEDLLLSGEDDSDDDDEVIDDKQYDLLLRDIVRPLGAWGFDVSSKIGFDSPNNGEMDEENEFVDDGPEDEDDNEDEDEDQGEGGGDETDNDDNTTGDNGTKKRPISPKPKPSPAKKKTGVKNTKKRKADETSGDSNAAPSAKKPAVDKSTADKKESAKDPPTTAAPQTSSTTDKPSDETK